MESFKLVSKFRPRGDQQQAITKLSRLIKSGNRFQTLLGVTGSGKTFTLAWVIAKVNLPTLVISHNKTLAAQLYAEFKEFFPYNAVEYFVSYYDYYQPEAYIPQTDTYIEKDASINERLDRLRLSATTSLLSRRDTLVVASVSCIYNLGSPQDYEDLVFNLEKNQIVSRREVAQRLVMLQYEKKPSELTPAVFRIKGDVLDIFPPYKKEAYRIEFFGEEIERLLIIDPLTGESKKELEKLSIYPAKHFLVSASRIEKALVTIEWELQDRLRYLKKQGRILEAERLQKRTRYDMEMLRSCGWCHGIENYSRHLSQRPAGSRPWCLLDFFPRDFLLIVDESHVTLPQIRGMYNGDRARKETLVEFGFRLPSCLDNRPLKFSEFFKLIKQAVFVSATPAEFELRLSGRNVVEQIIRPTGLLDPEVEVRPNKGKIDDIIKEIKQRAARNERVLITTLTKRMAEELCLFLKEAGLRVEYLHSEIDALARAQILQNLRRRKFDCLVGINLLREGLDLPEVSLVIILDADREGFLRSYTSLIQTAGRAARNAAGKVILYADEITVSMRKMINETRRRRRRQMFYNRRHGIKPQTIKKEIKEGVEIYYKSKKVNAQILGYSYEEYDLRSLIETLKKEMLVEAKNLHFEKAAQLRDKIKELEEFLARKN